MEAIVKFLSDNWKTLFDGVLGLIVVGILGFLLPKLWKRWAPKKEELALAPTQTAGPLAPAANAVEGGIVHQTVNYFPPVAPGSSPIRKTEVKTKQSPRPNIQFHTTRLAQIDTDDNNVVRQHPAAGVRAVLLNVTNDALQNVLNGPASVKATLIFYDVANPDNPKHLARATGAWIDRQGEYVHFDVDASHDLLLMGLADGICGTCAVKRSSTEFGLNYTIEGFDLPASKRLRVKVRLIDYDSGELYCEREYDIDLPSLEVSYKAG